MHNNGTRGYHGYRGRRPGGRRWVVVLLLLILLAAAVSLLGQRYLVYDMDGSYHFEFPWTRTAAEKKLTLRGARKELEIVIERPDEPQAAPLRALELDGSALGADMDKAIAAVPEDVNALAVRIKTVRGDLLYPTALPEAIEAGAAASGENAAAALKTLTGSGYYTIARLSALHDSRFSLSRAADAAILQRTHKNVVWYAPDNSFYLAPEKELARQYLCSIAREAAALGFDELLFDEFGYPATGRLANIDADGRELTQEEALSLLADNLRETLSDSGTKLSLWLDEKTVLDGANEKTGQRLADLAVRFERIYVPTTAEKIPALLAALAPYTAELVPVLDAAVDGVYLIAAS